MAMRVVTTTHLSIIKVNTRDQFRNGNLISLSVVYKPAPPPPPPHQQNVENIALCTTHYTALVLKKKRNQ